jgi:hypothetical protein
MDLLFKRVATLAAAAVVGLSGCAGVNTFSASARAGDTVAVMLGWNQPVARQNLQVNISGAGGAAFTYPPGDPNVRLVANFYPDPASRLIVGRETNQSLGVNANLHAENLETAVTGNDKDYAQTLVLVNLPATLPVGTATVQAVNASTGAPIASATVNVIGAGGSPQTFQGTGGAASAEMLGTLERAEVKSVSFSGPTVPYAIQLDLTYTQGTPWVVNPRGDLKSVSWSSDGARIKLILLPASQISPAQMSDFKFFVAGGLVGLAVDAASVKAFDASGNAITGVVAHIN